MEADSEVATNYHTLEAEVIAELSTRDRFAPIEERQDTGVLALDVISTISHGNTLWKGNKCHVYLGYVLWQKLH